MSPDPALTPQHHLSHACAELNRRLRAGEACRTEELLAQFPLLAESEDAVLELIYTEFVARRAIKQPMTLADLIQRFPHLRERLERLFQVDGLFVAPSRSTPAVGDDSSGEQAGELLPMLRVPGRLGRYYLVRQVGKGGFGVVYQAHDLIVKRDIALKVPHPGIELDPALLQRFLGEARAAGGFHHPNIMPVYDAGELETVHFLASAYCPGPTLARWLADFPGPVPEMQAAALVELLARAVAHVHEQKILHRDLKPGNVLMWPCKLGDPGSPVGIAFVPQLTDFGLARVFEATGGLSSNGDRVGTPSYMAPEQVEGRSEQVGPPTDVWAMGVILYELLLKQRPFPGVSDLETQRLVLEVEPVPPRRLRAGLHRDLETICLKCLEKEPSRRYATAQALAEDVQRFREDRPILARPIGRLGRAWRWAKRNPRESVIASLLMLLLAVGGTVGWVLREQQAAAVFRQQQADDRARDRMAQARTLLEAGWQSNDTTKLSNARALAEQASEIATGAGATVRDEAAQLQEQVKTRIDAAEKNRVLLAALLDVLYPRETLTYTKDKEGSISAVVLPTLDEQFTAAFRRWGMDPEHTLTAEIVSRIKDQPESVIHEVVDGLDRWLLARREADRPEAEWRALFELAEQLDRDDRRREIRRLVATSPLKRTETNAPRWDKTRGELRQLAGQVDVPRESVMGLLALVRVLHIFDETPTAESILRSAAAVHRGEALLHFALGSLLQDEKPPRWTEAIESYRAACASRPQTGMLLGMALVKAKRPEEGETVLRDLARRQPDDPEMQFNLGWAFHLQKKFAEAEAAYREALKIHSHYGAAYRNLGVVLFEQKKLDEAIVAIRKDIDIQPSYAGAYLNLGIALHRQKKLNEAVAAYQKAIKLRNGYAEAYSNLGLVLHDQQKWDEAVAAFRKAIALRPNDARPHYNLGRTLRERKEFNEALVAYENAVKSDPQNHGYWIDFGQALKDVNRFKEAVEAYYRALKIDPQAAPAWDSLGTVRLFLKDYLGAVAAHKKAVQFDSNNALYRINLGMALSANRDDLEAIDAYQSAIKIDSNDPKPHIFLGGILMRLGRLGDAKATYQNALKLAPSGSQFHQIADKQLQACDRLLALDERLPAIIEGKSLPANNNERLQLADTCARYLMRFRASVALYVDAFTAEPKLVDDPRLPHRFNAARAAALAGCGQGKDADSLDDPERTRLRQQALTWLRAELAKWTRLLEIDPEKAPAIVRQAMQHWQKSPDFAGVREANALANLPAAERSEWRKLWQDVEALRQHAAASK